MMSSGSGGIMVLCPECETDLNVEEEEVDEGEIVSCPECGTDFEVVTTSPLELKAVEEGYVEEEEEVEAEDGEDASPLPSPSPRLPVLSFPPPVACLLRHSLAAFVGGWRQSVVQEVETNGSLCSHFWHGLGAGRSPCLRREGYDPSRLRQESSEGSAFRSSRRICPPRGRRQE